MQIKVNKYFNFEVLNQDYNDIYYWSISKFMNRYYIMKVIYNIYIHIEIIQVLNIFITDWYIVMNVF